MFSQNPADSVDNVAFTTTIGSYYRTNPGGKGDGGFVDKRLKSEKFKQFYVHEAVEKRAGPGANGLSSVGCFQVYGGVASSSKKSPNANKKVDPCKGILPIW